MIIKSGTNMREIISGNINRLKTWVNKRIRLEDTANTFVGEDSGKVVISTAGYNTLIGYNAGYSNKDGYSNTFLGANSGRTNISGIRSVNIGSHAGYYETESNKLFIDNTLRANEADARIKALIYGIFDAATANQRLSINGQLLVSEVATYANDAAAGTGGLVPGEVYKHADGSLHIKL